MLTFEETKENHYKIYNQKEEFLGEIRKARVGAYQHWCFFPDEAPLGDLWFSAGCMDEIRKFMKNPERYLDER